MNTVLFTLETGIDVNPIINYPTSWWDFQTSKFTTLNYFEYWFLPQHSSINCSRVLSSMNRNICSDQSSRMCLSMVGSLRNFYMLSSNVLMPYSNNHCITTCFGCAWEAFSAAGDAEIPSDFASYFGASGFLWWYIFCHSMVEMRLYKFSVTFLQL